MQLKLKHRLVLRFTVLALIGCLSLSGSVVLSVAAKTPTANPIVQSQANAVEQEQRGRELYLTGDLAAAAIAWQQAVQAYGAMGDGLSQARVLSNLSVAYQQLGKWPEATQAITDSLNLLQTGEWGTLTAHTRVLAQALNTQGILQLALGQSEQALDTWQLAADTYAQAEDDVGIIRSQINQAQALQALGLYRRALKVLTKVNQALETQPEQHLKAVGLRIFGNILCIIGELKQSRQVLEQSLAIAQRLESREDIGAALLGLGNTARASGDSQGALEFYEQGLTVSTSTSRQVQIKLAQLSLLLETEQWEAAEALWPKIQPNLGNLPPSHATIYAQINFARSLTRLKQAQMTDRVSLTNPPSWMAIAQLLAGSVQQAKNLGDKRAQAYALGNLGEVYEQTQQWSMAQDLTEQALLLAQGINAPDIAYRWQWQLGRILKTKGNSQRAIAAYSEAVNTLKSLSSDLVAVNPDVQFSFRDSVEPVYRELVSLLLQPDSAQSQNNLAKARDVIESLQLAELDNFFREACLDAQPVQIDRVDRQAAVIYPIILSDRLEVILSLPQQSLRHYTTPISADELERVIDKLRQTLVIRSRRQFFAPSQKLYDWLIRPAAADLAKSGVKTLVFVLDGPLRNIPMATLHDGEQYLIEQYSIALTPGLQLLDPRALQKVELKTLAAGLTEQRQNFPPLDYVAQELEQIKAKVSSIVLLDRAFTKEALREEIEFSTFPVVHIATHGQFSSNLAETFILAWDSPISISQLDNILQARSPSREEAIELLVLSACETAAGDKRAALGLAGMAVRSGARSTMATLWSVNDQATAEFMSKFYEELAEKKVTKAEALRQAQLTLLKTGYRWYGHPFYWAPYVLLGNWL
ncbi:MAG: CHAT domain-containing protein [Xenococcaceae cyanobacterium]